jgi:lipoprotein-anchoring transpeptidase ErfK/SrfK
MTRARTAVTAAASLLALAALLALAPSAGAEGAAPTVARVGIHGSGTLTRPYVAVLAKPRAGAPRVAVLRQFRADYRPQYVLALASVALRETGEPLWYRVSVPGRPNGRTGWVRASLVDLQPMRKRLVIDRSARTFRYFAGGKVVRSGRVAVGKPGAETPLGLFYVTWKFSPKIDPEWSILGAYAFETSAYSKLTDWPGGGIVGVHGTPWPNLLGQAVSHGCVRMSNANADFLRPRIPLGMPIKIVR